MRPIVRPAAVAVSLLAATIAIGNPNDCTFEPHHFRSAMEMWHDLSVRAEQVAPTRAGVESTTVPGRRRSIQPPSYSPPQFKSANFVDDEVFAKMVQDHVPWTSPSGDAEFFRRVSLDLGGQIPDAAAVTAFLADTASNKREKTIDALLASDNFAEKWTMWFGDLVQNVQVSSATSEFYPGRNAWRQYIYDSIKSGKPYDQMVREELAGAGRSFTNGETNYWVRQIQNNGPQQDTYDNLSSSTGEKFLGMPLICLSCHNGLGHLELVNTSMAKRTRNDFWKNAAFFAQVSAQSVAGVSGTREYIISDLTSGEYRLNTTSGNKTPRQPAAGQSAVVAPAFFLSSEEPKAGETRRQAYARIITANPQFARATVNYVWKAMFGIGLVEPADSFDLLRQDPATLPAGATLQPTHPQLLTKLANFFVANNYDLRALVKTIVMSNTYQLSSRYTAGPWSEAYAPYYARHYPRRLMAEEVLDAITTSTGVGANLGVTGLSAVPRAMALPDPTEGGSFRVFLNNFGRGNRDDDTRSDDTSIVQALALLNDRTVTDRVKTTATGSKLGALLKGTTDPGAVADALYLNILGRKPSDGERAFAIAYLKSGELAKKSEDLQFALINKLEFLFN